MSELFSEFQHVKKRAFLETFVTLGSVTKATRVVGIDQSLPYIWNGNDPEFAEAYKRAQRLSAQHLVEEARRRAHEGIEEPVVYKGQISGHWVDSRGRRIPMDSSGNLLADDETLDNATFIPLTVPRVSDTLLIFLLKGLDPETFGDRSNVTLRGDKDAPLQLEGRMAGMTADQIRDMMDDLQEPLDEGEAAETDDSA